MNPFAEVISEQLAHRRRRVGRGEEEDRHQGGSDHPVGLVHPQQDVDRPRLGLDGGQEGQDDAAQREADDEDHRQVGGQKDFVVLEQLPSFHPVEVENENPIDLFGTEVEKMNGVSRWVFHSNRLD